MKTNISIAVFVLFFLAPVSAVMSDAARGKELYREKKCYACHGMEGKGGGIAGPAIDRLPLSRDDLIALLKKGTKRMRPMKKKTPEEDIAALVDYIFSLQHSDRGNGASVNPDATLR
ncbi:MAG: cytochrome c [Deltaproteobacteria bacterium]|nr:cytochrome c [Deltaproteobacteria bacterium]